MRINRYTVKLVKEGSINYSLEEAVISPEIARDIIEKVFDLSSSTVEKFGLITLTTKNKIAGLHIIAIGGLNQSAIEAREVFQQALLNNAASLILFHNHPSGEIQPSREDILFTKKLNEAGQIIGVKVLDHIIIGEGGRYASLKDKGLF
ncbi:MAG: JAB domain-containing protein [Ignavibacteriales bacterium]